MFLPICSLYAAVTLSVTTFTLTAPSPTDQNPRERMANWKSNLQCSFPESLRIGIFLAVLGSPYSINSLQQWLLSVITLKRLRKWCNLLYQPPAKLSPAVFSSHSPDSRKCDWAKGVGTMGRKRSHGGREPRWWKKITFLLQRMKQVPRW